jgi:hypothetical protein
MVNWNFYGTIGDQETEKPAKNFETRTKSEMNVKAVKNHNFAAFISKEIVKNV